MEEEVAESQLPDEVTLALGDVAGLPADVQRLVDKAKRSWLTGKEVLNLLLVSEELPLSTKPSQQPASESVLPAAAAGATVGLVRHSFLCRWHHLRP